MALVAEESGLSIDYETSNGDLDVDSRPRVSHYNGSLDGKGLISTGWQFTEALEGYISVPGGSSFEISEREGKGSSSAIRMLLTVEIQRRVQGTWSMMHLIRAAAYIYRRAEISGCLHWDSILPCFITTNNEGHERRGRLLRAGE